MTQRRRMEVWRWNLERELEDIRAMLPTHPYVSVMSVYPGIVARPLGTFKSSSHLFLQSIITNVNLMNILQLGITLFDEEGNMSSDCSSWQFNFFLDQKKDVYLQTSLDLLRTTTGIDPKKHENEGVKHEVFAVLLTTSGLVLNPDIVWITFEGGHHISFLLSILMGEDVPYNKKEFFEFMRLYFPKVFDVKHLSTSVKNLSGAIMDMADKLKVTATKEYDALNLSVVAGRCFFKMKELYFEDSIDEKRQLGICHQLADITPPFS
eukprot:m.16894 g.16894  ORF g.16894 m.16894 type:complete len:265 (-) comp4683_c0_seq1:50-844(-)